MTREEIIRNLKYTMEKHKNDNVPTFGTNISLMCKDILNYLEQEKIGHWIITSFSVTGRRYQCSECSYIHTFTNFKYCPNCRTKMESEG